MKHKNQIKPKSENPLNDPRRLYVCSFKASWWQRQEMQRLADFCGEDFSTYALMRALNYQPKARLTETEAAGLENLRDCRRDIRKFFNALEGYKREERQVFFRRHSYMIEWAKILMDMADRIEKYLDKVEAPNDKPQATGRL